jgi:subtilisin-like proprotein convertase family protein
VQLNISHSYVSDLNVLLTSPNGTQVQLFSNQCGSNNDINAVFDDAGIPLICSNNPAISGTLIPAQALSAFNGQVSQGVWTLTVSDTFDLDGGAINSWGINFCSPTPPLDVTKNEFSDLMIYPNPNSGNFNVNFKNAISDKVEVNVFDISGRTIFKKNYNVQGDFNENIQLNGVQAGVYLLSLFDGERTQVQRIIIK